MKPKSLKPEFLFVFRRSQEHSICIECELHSFIGDTQAVSDKVAQVMTRDQQGRCRVGGNFSHFPSQK